MLEYSSFVFSLINFVPPIFFVSAERNDQTEQEERREIKQRLNRKVRIHTHLRNRELWETGGFTLETKSSHLIQVLLCSS